MADYKTQLIENYGFLFEEALLNEILKVARYQKVLKGDVILDHDQLILGMPLLLNGTIKISRQDHEGDELLLYYLEQGDTCSMTLSCCMHNKKSEIRAVAETDVELMLIPLELMRAWIKKFDTWLEFVFNSYQSRFNELLEAIDNLAFNDLHVRIHKYLKEQVVIQKTNELDISHQDIATDLYTSRVVVSRILKSLEREKKLNLGRNKIEILDF